MGFVARAEAKCVTKTAQWQGREGESLGCKALLREAGVGVVS